MSEIQQPLPLLARDGAVIAVQAGYYGIIGGIAGLGVGELGVIPLGFPEEFTGFDDRNDQIYDIRGRLRDDEAALNQAKKIEDGVVDYSGLEQRIATQEAQLETLENSHIPYDDIQQRAKANP